MNIVPVNDVCANFRHPPKKERNLSGVRTVKLLVIVVWTAREKLGFPPFRLLRCDQEVGHKTVKKLENSTTTFVACYFTYTHCFMVV